jgi:hypothetical protein
MILRKEGTSSDLCCDVCFLRLCHKTPSPLPSFRRRVRPAPVPMPLPLLGAIRSDSIVSHRIISPRRCDTSLRIGLGSPRVDHSVHHSGDDSARHGRVSTCGLGRSDVQVHKGADRMISDRPTIHPTEENQRLALVIVGAWSSKAPTWLPSRSRTSADSCPGDTGLQRAQRPRCDRPYPLGARSGIRDQAVLDDRLGVVGLGRVLQRDLEPSRGGCASRLHHTVTLLAHRTQTRYDSTYPAPTVSHRS